MRDGAAVRGHYGDRSAASHAAGRLVVRQLALPALVGLPGVSAGRTDDLAVLPIDNLPETIEPENIAFSPDSRFAYVTMQENNAVLRLDLQTGDMPAIGLGSTTHAADLTNGGGYSPTEPLAAFREPDGIAVDETGRFFVTADEGDTRTRPASRVPAADAPSASSMPGLARSSPTPARSSTMRRRRPVRIRTSAATEARQNQKASISFTSAARRSRPSRSNEPTRLRWSICPTPRGRGWCTSHAYRAASDPRRSSSFAAVHGCSSRAGTK